MTEETVIHGLHDHHVHLRAMAAARSSIDVSLGLDRLRSAPGDGWLRAVGYAGDELDRWQLDAVVGHRPVRVQHRTGALWILNSAGARAVGLPDDHDGRLFRMDDWLRDRVPPIEHDLVRIGTDALALCITAFTDTTPDRTIEEADELRAAVPQQLHLMMPLGVATHEPVKVLLDDVTLPSVDDLAATITAAHGDGRAVAVHCVTRVQLVIALAAGLGPGDRVEHGAVIPEELIDELARRELTVVTQPNFVVERGDRYRREVDPDDLPHLYRAASLVRAGVHVLGGTDAPYGRPDPWAAMRAAVSRDLNPEERLTPQQALALFATGPGRVVLGVPVDVALRELDPANIAATVLG